MPFMPNEIPREINIGGKKLKLQEEDMAKASSFESDYINLGLFLEPKKGTRNPNSETFEATPDSSVRVRFQGGKFQTKNEALTKLMMTCSAYHQQVIRIDREDPTGFWRELNAIQVKTVPVVIRAEVSIPDFDALDLKRLTQLEEGQVIEPVRVVGA